MCSSSAHDPSLRYLYTAATKCRDVCTSFVVRLGDMRMNSIATLFVYDAARVQPLGLLVYFECRWRLNVSNLDNVWETRFGTCLSREERRDPTVEVTIKTNTKRVQVI